MAMEKIKFKRESWHYKLAKHAFSPHYGQEYFEAQINTSCNYVKAVIKGVLVLTGIYVGITLLTVVAIYGLFGLFFHAPGSQQEFVSRFTIAIVLYIVLGYFTSVILTSCITEKNPESKWTKPLWTIPEPNQSFISFAYQQFKDKVCRPIEFIN